MARSMLRTKYLSGNDVVVTTKFHEETDENNKKVKTDTEIEETITIKKYNEFLNSRKNQLNNFKKELESIELQKSNLGLKSETPIMADNKEFMEQLKLFEKQNQFDELTKNEQTAKENIKIVESDLMQLGLDELPENAN